MGLENRGQVIFFRLITSAVSGQPLSAEDRALYAPAMLPGMTALARRHDLVHLLALGLKNNGLLSEGSGELENEIFRAVVRCEQLNYELARIGKTLEAVQIPFLPLKGSVLRRYYPEPWMRTSCDIDVFVHEEDLDRVLAAVAEAAPYRMGEVSPYVTQIFTQHGQNIELHRGLIEADQIDRASAVLSTVWDTAARRDGWRFWYEMPDEMFYFYHIAHMAKHFENGGCGIRPFLDIWVLTHRVPHDRDKREKLLADGGLSAFAKHAEHLSDVWFGDGTHDDTTCRLEQFIVRGGVYGTQDNRISIQQVRLGGKQGYLRSRVWLSYEKMKSRYPSLDGKPALLPLYEAYRWGRLLFCGGVERSVNELRVSSGISEERSEAARLLLSELGLREHGST